MKPGRDCKKSLPGFFHFGDHMKKISFICKDGLEHFLVDLCNEISSYYEISLFLVRSKEDIDNAVQYGDILWFEWADDIAVYGSQSPIVRHKKSIVRLHRYEAFTHMPKNINWSNINNLVVVNDGMKDVLAHGLPDLALLNKISVIPNGVNMERFAFSEHCPGYDIAWVGHINARKNLPMALQIIKHLAEQDKRFTLHIAGDFQDYEQELYTKYFIMNNNLDQNVVFSGWVNDMNKWLENKNYILSTSIHESFGYAIAEAMSKGIKPIIHEFHGAYSLWDSGYLFFDVDQAVFKILNGEYLSETYRKYVEDKYSLASQVESTKRLLDNL